MLKPTTLTQTLITTADSALPRGMLGQPALAPRWPRVSGIVPLPDTFGSFLLYTLALCVLAAVMGLHVLLSIQMISKRQELTTLQAQYSDIQNNNAELLWQLHQNRALSDVYVKAVQMGFEPIITRHFVMGEWSVSDLLDATSLTAVAR